MTRTIDIVKFSWQPVLLKKKFYWLKQGKQNLALQLKLKKTIKRATTLFSTVSNHIVSGCVGNATDRSTMNT